MNCPGLPEPEEKTYLLHSVHSNVTSAETENMLKTRGENISRSEALLVVLVRLGCYNKTAQSEELMNRKHLFLMFLGWDSEVKVPADSCLGRARVLVHSCCLLSVSSHSRRGEGTPRGLFDKGTHPILGLWSHDQITSPRPHL